MSTDLLYLIEDLQILGEVKKEINELEKAQFNKPQQEQVNYTEKLL
jgi:hypothetical protein